MSKLPQRERNWTSFFGRNVVVQLVIVTAAMLVWNYLAQANDKVYFLFGGPGDLARTLYADFASGAYLKHFGVTFAEVSIGYVIGNAVGTFLGLMFWFVPRIENAVRPYLVSLSSVPLFALAPMMLVWFGPGYMGKVWMVVLSIFGLALYRAFEGVSSVDPRYLRLAQSMRFSKAKTFLKFVAPATMRDLMSAYRINIGVAIVGAYIGELISSNEGLGYYINRASGLYDMPRVLGGLLGLVAIGGVLRGLIRVWEKRLGIR